MWYEIIPSFGLVYGLLFAPTLFAYAGNKIFRHGKTCARDWDRDQRDFMLYLRDHRVTGSEYIPKGLEAIPDLD